MKVELLGGVGNRAPEATRLLQYVHDLEEVAAGIGEALRKLAGSGTPEPELMRLAIRASSILGHSDALGTDISSLANALEEVKRMKQAQDADYYLAALLLNPMIFRENGLYTSVQFHIQQFKQLEFIGKKWQIGGDVSFCRRVILRGRPFLLVVNADAMGKSIQGAMGAIVFAAAFRAIIGQASFSNDFPEKWMVRVYRDLDNLVDSFEGRMLVSFGMILIDEEGEFCYSLNAGHPRPLLYRAGCAEFIQTSSLPEIGTGLAFGEPTIETVRLQNGDVIFMGSDGRDDLRLREGLVNQDPDLFKACIEQGEGKMDALLSELVKAGEWTDDLSIIRVAFERSTPLHSDSEADVIQSLRQTLDAPDTEARLRALDRSLSARQHLLSACSIVLVELQVAKNWSAAARLANVATEIFPWHTGLIFTAALLSRKDGNMANASIHLSRLQLRSGDSVGKMWADRYFATPEVLRPDHSFI